MNLRLNKSTLEIIDQRWNKNLTWIAWPFSAGCILRFTKIGELCEQKSPVTIAFFAASIIITNTGNEPWNTETHPTDRNPSITNHDVLNPLFPEGFLTMIAGIEKRKRQLAFKIQNSRVWKSTVTVLQRHMMKTIEFNSIWPAWQGKNFDDSERP